MALLQQQFALAIQDERREGPMQDAGAVVAGALVERTHGFVFGIDQNEPFGFRRDDLVLVLGEGGHARIIGLGGVEPQDWLLR